jgi:transposase
MPAAIMSPAQWREVQTVAETGMHLKDVAAKFGVDYETVRKRAMREEWLTIRRVENLREKQMQTRSLSQNVPKASEVVAETLEERRNHHREMMHRIGLKLAEKAEKNVESGRLDILDVAGLEKLQKVIRLNLDMATGEAGAVQVNLWSGGSSVMAESAERVIDVESVRSEAEEWV